MLLLLAEFLQQYYSGFAVFQYLTLRGILGLLTALAMALFANRDSAARRILAAAGRLSLTNYLLSSVVFALLFYSWGLGLFGTMPRSSVFALAFVPIVLMMAWSQPWLAGFRQGPFEWMWRGLARGRFAPILR